MGDGIDDVVKHCKAMTERHKTHYDMLIMRVIIK